GRQHTRQPTARRPGAQGSTLFRRGDPAQSFFYVMEGGVRLVRRHRDGLELVVEVIEPGQTFAEAKIFEPSTYPVDAVAVSETVVVGFSVEHYRSLLADDPELSWALLGRLSRRIHSLMSRVHALALESASERVAGFILARTEDDDCLRLNYPKHVLAGLLSMTPESLSRALGRLRDRGILEVRGLELYVKDRQALESFIDLE
ncbi:MAG: Crp/Fnr family transcriptional regulator, partial [Myxococcota bacterium]